VLAWLVLSLWLWRQGQRANVVARTAPAAPQEPDGRTGRGWMWASAAVFGLACASKPTAWFLAPFYVLLLAGGDVTDLWRRPASWLRRACILGWPAVASALLVIGPYLVWNPGAMVDDVWRWASGSSATAYQIWGWGASNLVIAAGWVKSRFETWPFWLPELIIGLPLLVLFVRRQALENTAARAFWSYGLLLLAFLFFSRFLNENYLGYITAVLAVGTLTDL
jgi:hypothetical protein